MPSLEENDMSIGWKDVNLETARDFSLAERQTRFIAYRAARLEEARRKQETEGWHEIDREMTPEQIEEISPGGPGRSSRSAAVWVRYLHRSLGRYVVSQGCYFFENAYWMAQYMPDELGDAIKRVEPIEWSPIRPGCRPEDVFIVPKHLSGQPVPRH